MSGAGSCDDGLAPLDGVREIDCDIIRRSPRVGERRPPATFWQPFGLTRRECPNSRRGGPRYFVHGPSA